MNGFPVWSRVGRGCVLVVVAAVCLSATGWGASPAASGGLTTADLALLRRVVRDPSDYALFEGVKKIGDQGAALRFLVTAFRDPATATAPSNNMRTDAGRETLLDAIADIFEDRAAEILVEAASDKSVWVRMYAIRNLQRRVKASTPATRRVIREALSDSDTRVSISALDALVTKPDPEAGAKVLEILRHPLVSDTDGSGNGYREALVALAAIGYSPALEDLFEIGRDPLSDVRALAAAALGPCAVDAAADARGRAVAMLKALVADPNREVCLGAANSLARLKDTTGVPVIAFEIKRIVSLPLSARDRGYELLPMVQALETATGDDFGSEVNKDQWELYKNDALEKNLAASTLRVDEIMARLAARGIAVDSYPALPTTLSDVDKKMLDHAFDKWLIDPCGATWVTFHYEERTAWGTTEDRARCGWLVAEKAGDAEHILLADGTSFLKWSKVVPADFLADARKGISDFKAAAPGPSHEDGYSRRELAALGERAPRAVWAAWLYRLGHEDLAAQILFIARANAERIDLTLDAPDADGAWESYAAAVHAYMVGADADALTAAERLEKLYPSFMEKYGSGTRLLAELRRRQREGVFHRPPAALPADFEQWPVDKKVERLIADLQDVDARQMGQPGGVDLTEDVRVKKLIALGDAAVPALIDCVDKDTRLTRSVHFWRDFAQNRGVIGVREAALSAVMSILRTRFFEPVSTGDDFTGRGSDAAKSTADRLRKYWDVYGKLSYDERMMKVLTDPGTEPDALLEAAQNLATFGEERRLGTMVFTGGRDGAPAAPNPLITKYKTPTVAEAIVAARDRHLKSLDPTYLSGYSVRNTDNAYAAALCTLGDRSIVPEISRRFAVESDLQFRVRWAMVAHFLHEDGPLRQLIAGVKAGTIVLARVDLDSRTLEEEPGVQELTALVQAFAGAEMAEADEALFAITDAGHPYHALAMAYVSFYIAGGHGREPIWCEHPFIVRLLRSLLDDTTPIATTYTLSEGRLSHKTPSSSGYGPAPEALRLGDPANRLAEGTGRACDDAAFEISERLLGVPLYHPLLKDADERLAAIKAAIDRYGTELRALSESEAQELHLYVYRGRFYIRRFRPLGRAATAADVAQGAAVFELGGQGVVAGLKLPATARLKTAHDVDGPRVLIVQAEVDSEKRVHYGVVGREAAWAVVGDALEDVRPVAGGE